MRWILRLTGALIVLVALVAGVFLFLPTERVAQSVTERLSEITGRDVRIDGPVRVTLWPTLSVLARDLRVANPDWAGPAPMIAADEARIDLTWGALFSGDVHVQSLELAGANLRFVRGADGRVSWNGNGLTPTALWLAFDRAEISRSRLLFVDQQRDQRWRGALDTAIIALPEAGGAASIVARGRLGNVPLEVTATLAGIAELMDGESQPLRADLVWPGGDVTFDGRAALEGLVEGQVDLDAPDLGQLITALGLVMPDLPDRLGRDHIGVTGEMTFTPDGTIHLRDGVLRLDETELNIALDREAGEDRPMLRGTVTGGVVALPGLALLDDGAWSDRMLDVSGLFATDADLTIRADTLDLGGTTLSEVDLRATLDRGRLVFDIAGLRAYGGLVAGEFVVNGRGGLSVGGDLIFANADMGAALLDLAGVEGVEGAGSVSVEFLGVGDDMRTIVDGLEAEGDLTLGAGNLPIAALAEVGDGAQIFDRIMADFRVREGVVLSDEVVIFAPWGNVDGAGRADLLTRTLTFRMTPGESAIPLLIEGPWANPEVGPDPAALARMEETATAARENRPWQALEALAEEPAPFELTLPEAEDTGADGPETEDVN
ncbi:AsmA-like C-terminal region-containing protein [Hasllibacter sp. MH4015]|uniref:AsmA family protein n=1 Tax=Hasllibacter sp. MH4015 TaxID=2854029 RepID=UPI001CD51342|nr:AsmA-like C-terminal region-containing protein [Hasllibacter sp. MH4015]